MSRMGNHRDAGDERVGLLSPQKKLEGTAQERSLGFDVEAAHYSGNGGLHNGSSNPTGEEKRTLLIACCLTTFFFFVELIGGYLAGSLAIMSDAAHLLSDLAGLCISLVAVSVSRLPANTVMSFGFARAEVLGAFVSLIFIWALTIVLVLFAINRLLHPSPVNGPLMLLLGAVGLAVNIALGLVLGHGHAHSHGNHSHGEDAHGGHGYGAHEQHEQGEEAATDDADSIGERMFNKLVAFGQKCRNMLLGGDIASVNVRAAYLHVLGDALQSVGVLIAAGVITLFPHWSVVDPLCTLLFAVIVVMTTKDLARETLRVLMEGAPPQIALRPVYSSLSAIPGVEYVADLHVWSITPRQHALSVHLFTKTEVVSHGILKVARETLGNEFGISHATIQINCIEPLCCSSPHSNGNNGNGTNLCLTSEDFQ